ncbi:MAG: Kelch repeat-containing protein [Parcubacteria group bacterium Gr01-1014_66]|nr:MAG: Kelch repeat-containing protein [Parcubacteria group bacterium Gr01-1014_66]
MPTPRGGIASTVLGGKLYVFGGEEEIGTIAVVEGYDSLLDRWHTRTAMPEGRHGLGAAASGDRIYVIGGGLKPGLSVSNINTVFTPF